MIGVPPVKNLAYNDISIKSCKFSIANLTTYFRENLKYFLFLMFRFFSSLKQGVIC